MYLNRKHCYHDESNTFKIYRAENRRTLIKRLQKLGSLVQVYQILNLKIKADEYYLLNISQGKV